MHIFISSVLFSHSVMSDSVTPWTEARQASLSITNSQSLLKLTSFLSVMSSNHLILCCPLLLPSSIFPSIRVFSNMSVLCIRWPKYWSLSISPSNEAGKTSLELMRPRFVCPLASVLHSALWSRRNLGVMTSSVNGVWALTVLLRTHQDGSSAFSRERAGWERWTAPLLRHSEP